MAAIPALARSAAEIDMVLLRFVATAAARAARAAASRPSAAAAIAGAGAGAGAIGAGMLEPAPAGAIPAYFEQRVQARLDGKITWFLGASFLIAALLSIRGWLPGSGRRDR